MELQNLHKSSRFDELFQELVSAMTKLDGRDQEKVDALLAELCQMAELTRAEVLLYRNKEQELRGECKRLCCYDSGEKGVPVLSQRIEPSLMAITVSSVYRRADAPPMSDALKTQVDLVMRMLMSFVSRERLVNAVEELAFFDDSGYRNIRRLRNYMIEEGNQGKLAGKVALNYNLRRFALVNKEIGRQNADIVLKNHYNGLSSIIGADGIVCRLGGDNFVAFCTREQLDKVLSYLREAAIRFDPAKDKHIRIACTAGVYLIPEGLIIQSPTQIMEKLITAFRAAHSSRKDPIVFYEDSLYLTREKSMLVQQRFPDGIDNEEFLVYYQPKVDVHTGELVGAEALCRWHQGSEMLPPSEFIPLLEEGTEICKLDFYMLEHVCQDIRRWLDQGCQVVRVSVNLSRKHMMNANLLEHILGIIDRYQVPHEYIEIELTETTTDVEFRDLKRVVSGLQKAGISTSVDDFGIGYSSLNLIRAIPWNVLKVDRSFLPMEDDNSDSNRSIMFKHVVAMAHEMGLESIAEGVETQSQVDVLRENDCDRAQGFFFDQPLPVKEFEKRLRQHYYKLAKDSAFSDR